MPDTARHWRFNPDTNTRDFCLHGTYSLMRKTEQTGKQANETRITSRTDIDEVWI